MATTKKSDEPEEAAAPKPAAKPAAKKNPTVTRGGDPAARTVVRT